MPATSSGRWFRATGRVASHRDRSPEQPFVRGGRCCCPVYNSFTPQFVHRWWINCGNLCPLADHLVSMNTEPMESIIYGSRYSAGRLYLADRWIRAKDDPDVRVVRDRFEPFVQVGSVVTVTGVAVEDPVMRRTSARGPPAGTSLKASVAGCYRTVDGRQETAGHACYESTAKRAKPPLRAALITLHGLGGGSHAASCDAMVRTDADGVAVLGGLCGDRARVRPR